MEYYEGMSRNALLLLCLASANGAPSCSHPNILIYPPLALFFTNKLGENFVDWKEHCLAYGLYQSPKMVANMFSLI